MKTKKNKEYKESQITTISIFGFTFFTALHPPKVWERFVDDVYSILKRTHLKNFFHNINNLHQNIKFTIEEEMEN